MKKPTRIVVTGGPGAGKTTAADLLRREIGPAVVIVPEAATLLFAGGFPRNAAASQQMQRAIYHVQTNLEDAQAVTYPDRILLCDRGTVDGAAYWPSDAEEGFFETMGSTLEDELARYDAVIFFETAARGGYGIEGGNPTRTENLDEAVRLDTALRKLWARHPRFTLVPNNSSFFKKLTFGLVAIESLVAQLRHD